MIDNESKEDLSAAAYYSPVIEELLAGTEEAPMHQQGHISAASTDTLRQIRAHLLQALEACNRQLERDDRFPPVNGSEFPIRIAARLAQETAEIERLLYAYIDNSDLDLYKTLRYLKKHMSATNSTVSVHYDGSSLFVYMPTFPSRGLGNDALVNQMLASELLSMTELPSWPKWQAVFYHVYPANASNIPKDVENYDYKKTIDLLAYAVRSSDNALNFSMMMDTVFTDCVPSGVYIHVTPKSSKKPDFSSWYASLKSSLNDGEKSHETTEKTKT